MNLFTLHHIYDQVSALINNQIDHFFYCCVYNVCVWNDHLHLNAPRSPGRQEALWGRCDRPRGETLWCFSRKTDGQHGGCVIHFVCHLLAVCFCHVIAAVAAATCFLTCWPPQRRRARGPPPRCSPPPSLRTRLDLFYQFGSVSCLLLICGFCSNCYNSVFPASATYLSG